AQILKAQNMITIMTKAHLLEENEEKMKLRKIVGDGGVDLFREIKGIKTTAVTRIHIDEIEDAEFDNLGKITKARKIKN
ncbi:11432_t:CDS:2, partial [Diversispora eburnea]